MKVGTDGVLLGAWVSLPEGEAEKPHRILDIGTGTGVIALMLAQRTDVSTRIDAVEIEPEAAAEASGNFAASPWSDRLQVHSVSVQQWAAEPANGKRYDLIVSNPPYFMAGSDFRRGFDISEAATQPTAARVAARHAEQLPFGELISSVRMLLHPHGRFAAIFPYREAGIFIAQAASRGLFVRRIAEIRGTPRKPVKRIAVECTFDRPAREAIVSETLCIEDGAGSFTAAYRELTRDFYLKF